MCIDKSIIKIIIIYYYYHYLAREDLVPQSCENLQTLVCWGSRFVPRPPPPPPIIKTSAKFRDIEELNLR